MCKISNQYYSMKENGTINLGRFSSKHIQEILKPSGSISMYYSTDTPNLVEKGIPGGILFFSLNEGNNPLYVDKQVLETVCTCKVNVYKKRYRYIMKIKVVKGDENNG